jgi:hypothetical protein
VTPFVNQRWGVAVFFTTAEPKPPLPIAELARLFGLTMAEARVAASIADGMPLGEVAARHGVTKNTVRGRRFLLPQYAVFFQQTFRRKSYVQEGGRTP